MEEENDYDDIEDDTAINPNRFVSPEKFGTAIASLICQLDAHHDIRIPEDEFVDLTNAAKLKGQELGAILSKALSNRPIFIDDEEFVIRILKPGELDLIKAPDC